MRLFGSLPAVRRRYRRLILTYRKQAPGISETPSEMEEFAHIYDFDLNVHEKIKDAAMFVSSSDREGISNSMLEAMAIGLPCVCTDCAGGGARMMIEDHVNGLLVPMKDVNALYLAMKEVIENPELAETMSRNAVKIKDRLRPEVICQQMLDAILGEEQSSL